MPASCISQVLVDRPDQTAEEFASAIVGSYAQAYPAMYGLTLSAIRTSTIEDVGAGVSLLARALRAYCESAPEHRAQVMEISQTAYRADDLNTRDFVDLRDLTQRLAAET